MACSSCTYFSLSLSLFLSLLHVGSRRFLFIFCVSLLLLFRLLLRRFVFLRSYCNVGSLFIHISTLIPFLCLFLRKTGPPTQFGEGRVVKPYFYSTVLWSIFVSYLMCFLSPVQCLTSIDSITQIDSDERTEGISLHSLFLPFSILCLSTFCLYSLPFALLHSLPPPFSPSSSSPSYWCFFLFSVLHPPCFFFFHSIFDLVMVLKFYDRRRSNKSHGIHFVTVTHWGKLTCSTFAVHFSCGQTVKSKNFTPKANFIQFNLPFSLPLSNSHSRQTFSLSPLVFYLRNCSIRSYFTFTWFFCQLFLAFYSLKRWRSALAHEA